MPRLFSIFVVIEGGVTGRGKRDRGSPWITETATPNFPGILDQSANKKEWHTSVSEVTGYRPDDRGLISSMGISSRPDQFLGPSSFQSNEYRVLYLYKGRKFISI